jgi:hypothetical protein
VNAELVVTLANVALVSLAANTREVCRIVIVLVSTPVSTRLGVFVEVNVSRVGAWSTVDLQSEVCVTGVAGVRSDPNVVVKLYADCGIIVDLGEGKVGVRNMAPTVPVSLVEPSMLDEPAPLSFHASTFFGLSKNGLLFLINFFPENLLLNTKLTLIWIVFFVDFEIYLLNITSPIFINVHRWNKSSNNFAKYNITR